MPFIDHLFSIGRIRKAIWQLWYPFLTRRLHDEEVLFLNYAYEEEPAMAIPLAPDDEPNRACIQLYHHVATQVKLRGKNVLEVSCGHGGGASYLTRTLQPKSYTALDLNPAGINFCKQRHRIDRLNFVQGDAGNLPFESNTFDEVINVEASHCYPDFPRFLAEVARVLRPGGHFLYADFRFADGMAKWENAIAAAPLKILHQRAINSEVLRGMNRNSRRSQDLVARHLPKFLHSLGADFAGVKGSRIHNALISDELSYRSYCFEKAAAKIHGCGMLGSATAPGAAEDAPSRHGERNHGCAEPFERSSSSTRGRVEPQPRRLRSPKLHHQNSSSG